MKVIFLDRDGVINKDIGYLHKISDFSFIDGIFETCKHFVELGYEIIVVTNQSGIARGYYLEKEFHVVTSWMINQFNNHDINILDVFFCPHGPKSKCNCRKPKPGLLNMAKDKFNVNMKKSWMIGDKESDINAANSAGIHNTILVKNDNKIRKNSSAKFILKSIKDASQVVT